MGWGRQAVHAVAMAAAKGLTVASSWFLDRAERVSPARTADAAAGQIRVVHIVRSPDLQALLDAYYAGVRDIHAAGMSWDAEVLDTYQEIFTRLQRPNALAHSRHGEVITLQLEDVELLKFFARWQALRRKAIGQLQTRGWRT